MLSIVFAAVTGKLIFDQTKKTSRWIKSLAIFFVVVAVVGGVYFPYQAIIQYYGPSGFPLSLDASGWLMRSDPDDYKVIQYINNNIHDRTIIAEAVGDSYSTYGRVSTYSGMIAPMGWKTHEWTWRFQGKAAEHAPKGLQVETGYSPIAKVSDDINRIYVTQNTDEALKLIHQYNIEYVFIGDLERTAYPNLDEDKFNKLGKVVFESGNSRLFEINN